MAVAPKQPAAPAGGEHEIDELADAFAVAALRLVLGPLHLPRVESPPRTGRPTMADDKTKTGKPDSDRINVNEPYELKYWSDKFAVTPERLKAAANTSGPTVKGVAALLGKTL
jgi:Protein of unknown function (DUF3606)